MEPARDNPRIEQAQEQLLPAVGDLALSEGVLPALPVEGHGALALRPSGLNLPSTGSSLVEELLALHHSLPSITTKSAERIRAAACNEHAGLFWTLCQSSATCHELLLYREHFNEAAGLGQRVQALGAAYVFAELVLREPLLAEETAHALSMSSRTDPELLDRLEAFYEDQCYLASLCARLPGVTGQRTSSVENALLKGALEPYFVLAEREPRTIGCGISAWLRPGPEEFIALKSAPLTRRERLFLKEFAAKGACVPTQPPYVPPGVQNELRQIFEAHFSDQRELVNSLKQFLSRDPKLSDTDYRFFITHVVNLQPKSSSALIEAAREVNRIQEKEIWSQFAHRYALSDNVPLAFRALDCVARIEEPRNWLAIAETYQQIKGNPANAGLYSKFLDSIEASLEKKHTDTLIAKCPKYYYSLHPELAPPVYPRGLSKDLKQLYSVHCKVEPDLFEALNAWLITRPRLKDKDFCFLVNELSQKELASKAADREMGVILDSYCHTSWRNSRAAYVTESCPLLAKALDCVATIRDAETFSDALPALLSVPKLQANSRNSRDFLQTVEDYFKLRHAERLCELSPEPRLDEKFAAANELLEPGVDCELQKIFLRPNSEEQLVSLLYDFLDRRTGSFNGADALYLVCKVQGFASASKEASEFLAEYAGQRGAGYGWRLRGKTPEACVLAIRALQSVRTVEDQNSFKTLLPKINEILNRTNSAWPPGFRGELKALVASDHREKLRR